MGQIIMPQPVTQALQILPLARGGRPKTLDELVRQFVCCICRALSFSDFFHPVMKALEGIDLIPDHQRCYDTAAAANDGEALIFRL